MAIRKKRTRYVPKDEDKALVEAWILMGLDKPHMARMMGIGLTTFDRAFAREIELGKEGVDGGIVANIKRQLKKDDLRVIPGGLAWVRMRGVPGFQQPPSSLSNLNKPGGAMRVLIINDPEEGLEEYRVADEGGTIEVSGHDPQPGGLDPDPLDESK